MIMRDEVRDVLQRAFPAVTDSEVDRYYATVETAMSLRCDRKFRWLRDNYLGGTARWPEGVDLQGIFDRIRSYAERQVRADYLDELLMADAEVERLTADEVVDLEQDVLKASPEAWKTRACDMFPRQDMGGLAEDLWPQERQTLWAENFYNLATALLTSMEYRGLALPEDSGAALARELYVQVYDAMADERDW
ncbi:hypothetical protein [Corynebacterium variabile]|uniref:Uncharacterized protein n=1 Tax=Corynebacterium variabile TaxID=1727 RepID=A0A4Y4C929_9CORY|nr:hypothetical protein [Corynebacterium variabile]GEC87653.1 hypothetical protein CVA01_29670 [Corynebacterium variabile]